MNRLPTIVILLLGLGSISDTSTLSSARDKRLLVPEVANGNIVFYITTQSQKVDPLNLTVILDGSPIVRGNFEVGNLHPSYTKYHLEWPVGRHQVTVKSSNAGTSLTSEVHVVGKHWVVLYFDYPPREGEFSLTRFDEEIHFQ